MIFLSAALLSLVGAIWENLPDDDCYNCVSYSSPGNSFSSQGLIQNHLIVGGRNTIFKLDFVKQIADQYPDRDISQYDGIQDISRFEYQNCLNGGRSEVMCANYYKVIIPIDDSTVLLCGTSAFNPQCDFRLLSDLSYSKRQDVVSGEGLCPANPASSVSYTTISTGVGFAGTCREVCNEYAISRMHLQAGSLVATARTFKTEEILSGADFVYSFHKGDYVYFLFKETALEEEREYVYSRVGRLCKNDVGSSSPFFKDYFKTFLKVRIYCTSNQPGQTPFDHNELGGAWFEDDLLYTTFSGPKNLYTGSILCTFTLQEIEAAFNGKYKVHDDNINKWVARPNTNPVQCSTHPSVYNASKVVLMYEPISSSSPLYSSPHRLTGLAGRNLTAFNSQFYELFSSNGEGDVIRVTYEKYAHNSVAYHQSYRAGEAPIHSILLDNDTIYALSDDSVTMIPADFDCSKPATCQSCIAHHYPLCGWCYGDGQWQCTKTDTCSANWISPLSKCEDPPQFVTEPQNETLKEGASVMLACTSRGNHPLYWSKEGGLLARKSKVMDNGYLFIPLLNADDAGCYRCNMNNTSGAVFAQACVIVLVAPVFTPVGKPLDQKIQQGYSNLILPCSGTGSPAPTPSWHRIGAELPEGSVVMNNGALKLIRVVPMDAGQYKCTLLNQEGFVDTIITIRVDTPPEEEITNGTEEQLNGHQINRRTIITLIICVTVVVICFLSGFVAFKWRRRRRKHRRAAIHEYLENDNPMAADCPSPLDIPLQALRWNNLQGLQQEEMQSPHSPGVVSQPEPGDDEAPPAYTERPHVLRQTSSDYHILSFPSPSYPAHASPSFLYQPIPDQHYCSNACRTVGPGPPPRFITSVPDNSPAFISTLPAASHEQYDTVPPQSFNTGSTDPPD